MLLGLGRLRLGLGSRLTERIGWEPRHPRTRRPAAIWIVGSAGLRLRGRRGLTATAHALNGEPEVCGDLAEASIAVIARHSLHGTPRPRARACANVTPGGHEPGLDLSKNGTVPADETRVHLVTSSLSIARELWRYGEPELAERALGLSPSDVRTVGDRAAALSLSGEALRIWPDGPKGWALPMAAIEHLEGRARPCRRARRLPERSLPAHLQATLEERIDAARELWQMTLLGK